MHPSNTSKTGLISPVAFSTGLLLLLLAPLFRGGNRLVVLIGLEVIAVTVLLAFAVSAAGSARERVTPRGSRFRAGWIGMPVGLWALLAFPLLIGVVHLTPLPFAVWLQTGGRELYAEALKLVGVAPTADRPLSLNPDATWVSLLASLPLLAAVLLGFHSRIDQVRTISKFVVGLSFLEVLLGLLQLAFGGDSVLYYDGGYPDSAIGTFANRSHYANFLIMAMLLYLWLASTVAAQPSHPGSRWRRSAAPGAFTWAQKIAWTIGGAVLFIGVLISRSRGAALTGLPIVLLAWMTFASLRAGRQGWRVIATVVLLGALGVVAIVGVDFISARYVGNSLGDSASFRQLLSSSTFTGAWEFWPWGAGWGTYEGVYPRFQPQSAAGYVEYAHHDYAQLLFEGGVFAVGGLAIWGVLYTFRAVAMVRLVKAHRMLENEPMLVMASGFALLAVMLHALVEFNMHIPANAIMAAFLAGIYLRPVSGLERNGRRS